MKNTVTLKSINANLPRLDTLRRDYAPAESEEDKLDRELAEINARYSEVMQYLTNDTFKS